jgi:hypothetical protein
VLTNRHRIQQHAEMTAVRGRVPTLLDISLDANWRRRYPSMPVLAMRLPEKPQVNRGEQGKRAPFNSRVPGSIPGRPTRARDVRPGRTHAAAACGRRYRSGGPNLCSEESALVPDPTTIVREPELPRIACDPRRPRRAEPAPAGWAVGSLFQWLHEAVIVDGQRQAEYEELNEKCGEERLPPTTPNHMY